MENRKGNGFKKKWDEWLKGNKGRRSEWGNWRGKFWEVGGMRREKERLREKSGEDKR